MSCCGGGCCWWKKKSDPSSPIHPPDHSPPHSSNPSTHPPDPPPPIHPPADPSSPYHSMPSGNPPVETGENPSSSKKPFSPIHPPEPSMPSRHITVETSSSEKPFSPTLAEVLTGFEKVDADIANADAFIFAIKEQLEGATSHKNAQDTPSTSGSNTDRLSNWASFTQNGATFLKFVSDQIGKSQIKGDFFQSGEVTQIVGDMLKQIGEVHWAVAGLSIVGYLVSNYQRVLENRTEYVDLLKDMLKLASHIKRLNNLSLQNEHREVFKYAFQYIVEGSIFCAFQLDSGNFFSFLKQSKNSDTLRAIRSNLDKIYQDLKLIVGIEILTQQREMLTQQQPVVLPLSRPDYPRFAVGIEEQLEAVIKLLNMAKTEDYSSSAVVIWGFGGIGKTTLAQAVVSTVDRGSYNYSRIELDEVSEKNNYIVIQQEILKYAFPSYQRGREIKLRDASDGRDKLTEAFKSETNKPVFLFIDNALHQKDLEKILPEDLSDLPQRSRILITTRILKVTDMLEERGLKRKDHQVKTLSDDHAAEILCNDPAIRDNIKDDLKKMVKVCNGIPLVLKMVGAHLRKQKYNVGRCAQILLALQRGGNIKENDLSNRLFDFVYNRLELSTQEAFKDICCFFDKGSPCRLVEHVVGADEVTSLQEAALITTVKGDTEFWGEDDNEVEVMSVHDIIRSIGRSLSKSSRIMDLNSWREAEKDEAKLRGIQGVWLQDEDDDEDYMLEKRHLNSMKDTLRILCWKGSADVPATDAVNLPELRFIAIADDIPWLDVEALENLTVMITEKLPTKQRGFLKLPESLRIMVAMQQPDEMWGLLKTVPNSSLEELYLLFSLTSESFNEERDNSVIAFNRFLEGLNKLKLLKVRGCESLCELPEHVYRLPQLSRLTIKSCNNMECLPELFGQLTTLTYLNLSCWQSLKALPSTFGQLENLQRLILRSCLSLEKLPPGLEQLRSLEYVNLKYCGKLESAICQMDNNIKVVKKSEHSCTDCQKGKKLQIEY